MNAKTCTGFLVGTLSLTLAACSSVFVESQAQPPRPRAGFTRTLVVVNLPGASRRIAEDTLVAQLPSLHPSTSYPTVPLTGITLGELRESARRNGFDGLLVVWPDGMTRKDYPGLATGGDDFPTSDMPASTTFSMRFVASLTALDGDHEIWKGIATQRAPDLYPSVHRVMTESMTAIAHRLRKDEPNAP
jgi:hypothetical protein